MLNKLRTLWFFVFIIPLIILVLVLGLVFVTGRGGIEAPSMTEDACTGTSMQSVSLDGVELTLCLPFNADHVSVAQPDDLVQSAAWVQQDPYQVLSLYTVPYSVRPAADKLSKSTRWVTASYKRATYEYYKPTAIEKVNGPSISLFNRVVQGTTYLLPDENSSEPDDEMLVSEWITEAGNRVWILRAISYGEFSDKFHRDDRLTTLDAIRFDSQNQQTPSTSLVEHKKQRETPSVPKGENAVTDLPPAAWWEGDCDTTRYKSLTGKNSYRLGAVYRNLVACGPGGTGSGTYSYGIPTTFGGAGGTSQLEFQCAELPKRYLWLLYGLPPRSADGVNVVNVYDNALPNLKKYANGTKNFGLAAGDILSYDTPSVFGHTSIVTSVTWTDGNGNGSYTIIEQNSSASGTRTNTITNWWLNSNSPITYILHDSNNGAGSPPLGVNASDGTFTDKVQVSWTPASGATYYKVYRSATNKVGSVTLLDSSVSSPYNDLSAVTGTTYWYFVKACNPKGCSSFSLSNSGYRASLVPKTLAPDGSINIQTPAFKWTRIPDATQYRFRVFKGDSTTPLFIKTVTASACGTVNCTNISKTSLGFENYRWQVRSYVNGTWQAWSVMKSFSLTDPALGFNSQFNSDMNGWKKLGTTNWMVNNNVMYTPGTANYWAQIQNIAAKYSNFDYSARIRRVNAGYDANYIMVRMGSEVGSVNQYWYPGYIFGYRNTGVYSVWKLNNDGTSEAVQPWAESTAIARNDWNILRVVANGGSMEFYINGTQVTIINDSTYSEGFIGVGMYDRGESSDQLKIDWAILTPISGAYISKNLVSSDQQASNEAALNSGSGRSYDGVPE